MQLNYYFLVVKPLKKQREGALCLYFAARGTLPFCLSPLLPPLWEPCQGFEKSSYAKEGQQFLFIMFSHPNIIII